MAASNEGEKKVGGGGGSMEPQTRPGASWDVVEGVAVMPEQRNHLVPACRLVSLVDNTARRDPWWELRWVRAASRRAEYQPGSPAGAAPHCEVRVGDVALERADE